MMFGEKKGNLFDVVKFVCAILVIGIHTEPFAQYWWMDKAFACLTRFAVPMFFCITGYFLFDRYSGEKLLKYVKRIMVYYLFWQSLRIVVRIGGGYRRLKKLCRGCEKLFTWNRFLLVSSCPYIWTCNHTSAQEIPWRQISCYRFAGFPGNGVVAQYI